MLSTHRGHPRRCPGYHGDYYHDYHDDYCHDYHVHTHPRLCPGNRLLITGDK